MPTVRKQNTYLSWSSPPLSIEEFWLSLLHAFSSATQEQDSDEAAILSSGTQNLESFADEEILLSVSFLDLLMIHLDETENKNKEQNTQKKKKKQNCQLEKWDFGCATYKVLW